MKPISSRIRRFFSPALKPRQRTQQPREPRECRPFHDETLIDCQPADGFMGGKLTVILYRCRRCRRHFTDAIPGTWSLAQLHRQQSEIADLERMAR